MIQGFTNFLMFDPSLVSLVYSAPYSETMLQHLDHTRWSEKDVPTKGPHNFFWFSLEFWKSVKKCALDKAAHTNFFKLYICPKAMTLDAKNPLRNFYLILQLYGVFLHNSYIHSLSFEVTKHWLIYIVIHSNSLA